MPVGVQGCVATLTQSGALPSSSPVEVGGLPFQGCPGRLPQVGVVWSILGKGTGWVGRDVNGGERAGSVKRLEDCQGVTLGD